jgi:hypothetical protein
MASIDLPRDLQDYFAFAETEPTRNGRRFSITLPYVGADGRLDRLQWWYHLSPSKEQVMGESAMNMLREQAITRFRVHIDRWLQNTGQVLHGDGAIPQLDLEGVRTPPHVTASYIAAPPQTAATMRPMTATQAMIAVQSAIDTPSEASATLVPPRNAATAPVATSARTEGEAQDEAGPPPGKTAYG